MRADHAEILGGIRENRRFWRCLISKNPLWLQNSWKPTPRPIYPQNVLFKHFRMHFVDCAEIASLLRKIDFSELRGRIYVNFVENSIWTKSDRKNARPFFEVKKSMLDAPEFFPSSWIPQLSFAAKISKIGLLVQKIFCFENFCTTPQKVHHGGSAM